jgi:hypothetical protein
MLSLIIRLDWTSLGLEYMRYDVLCQIGGISWNSAGTIIVEDGEIREMLFPFQKVCPEEYNFGLRVINRCLG